MDPSQVPHILPLNESLILSLQCKPARHKFERKTYVMQEQRGPALKSHCFRGNRRARDLRARETSGPSENSGLAREPLADLLTLGRIFLVRVAKSFAGAMPWGRGEALGGG